MWCKDAQVGKDLSCMWREPITILLFIPSFCSKIFESGLSLLVKSTLCGIGSPCLADLTLSQQVPGSDACGDPGLYGRIYFISCFVYSFKKKYFTGKRSISAG
jgi:hypothetical protein